MTVPARVRFGLALLLCCCLSLVAGGARAHEIESASLSLREVAQDRFLVHWQATSQSLQAELASAAVFPEPCRLQGAELRCAPPGLVGSLEFPWLEGTVARVLVDVEWRDGRRLSRVLTAGNPSVNVYGMRATGLRSLAPVIRDYTRLGVEHILFGFDHLLFVVALAILVRSRRQLVATITAFTLAHSVTLAATVLGLVHVPVPPVEAAIALSIVLICAECLRPGDSLARAAPWAVAFAFGLLHGFGFASALLELGVPEAHVPAALICFNVGVELGQLAIILVAIGVERLILRLRLARHWQRPSLVYAMGGVAAFWSLDRIAALFVR
jgi:hydrogenase/urease accessory protein HupE